MEQWKGIYHDYLISTEGNVDSLKRKTRRRMSPQMWGEYLRVVFTIGGKRQPRLVHRLVAETFIPNPENKPEVNHINGDKTDNRVENLEWVTHSENMRHAFNTGLKKSAQGVASPRSKFTEEQVLYIRNNPDGMNTIQLSKMFSVSSQTISDIQQDKTYRTVGGKIWGKRKGGSPKISDTLRKEICSLYVPYSREFGAHALARRFGIAPQTIFKIISEYR